MERIVVDLQTGEQTAVPLTQEEILAVQKANEERAKSDVIIFNNLSYAQKRLTEYPSIGDQMDALWKGGDVAAEMLAQIKAVKAKYPKGA
jgi:hypothetical protein